jgi:hypothetical protein
MSCVLRISGPTLDIDALLSCRTLEPCAVWRKGTTSRGRRRPATVSGANFAVGEGASDEFDAQVVEAMRFLFANADEVNRLVRFAGVESAVLDFGVSIYEDTWSNSCRFPVEILALAARTGVELEVTYYKTSGHSTTRSSTRLRA